MSMEWKEALRDETECKMNKWVWSWNHKNETAFYSRIYGRFLLLYDVFFYICIAPSNWAGWTCVHCAHRIFIFRQRWYRMGKRSSFVLVWAAPTAIDSMTVWHGHIGQFARVECFSFVQPKVLCHELGH